MANKTNIEWADRSWNPIRAYDKATGKRGWFCVRVSEECRNCYAASFNVFRGTGHDFTHQNLKQHNFMLANIDQPIRWTAPQVIFVNSMTDLFADFFPDDFIDRVYCGMVLAPQHIYIILTKRAERMAAYWADPAAVRTRWFEILQGWHDGRPDLHLLNKELAFLTKHVRRHGWPALDFPDIGGWPLSCISHGISAGTQKTLEAAAPHLLNTFSRYRIISAEPLLEAIDVRPYIMGYQDDDVSGGGYVKLPHVTPYIYQDGPDIHQIIVGGESLTKNRRAARPMHPDWVRRIRDDCKAAGVSFMFKQWGEWGPYAPMVKGAFDYSGVHSLATDGTLYAAGDLAYPNGPRRLEAMQKGHDMPGTNLVTAFCVGKGKSGRELDGQLHDEHPYPIKPKAKEAAHV